MPDIDIRMKFRFYEGPKCPKVVYVIRTVLFSRAKFQVIGRLAGGCVSLVRIQDHGGGTYLRSSNLVAYRLVLAKAVLKKLARGK